MPALNGYSTTTVSNITYDSGVVYIAGVPHSVSLGGVRVVIEEEWHEVDFDGRGAPVDGLDYAVATIVTVSGSFLELGATQIQRLLHNVVGVLAAGVTTWTPRAARAFLATGNYVQDLTFEVERGDGFLLAIPLDRALVKYAIAGQDRNEGLIDVSFVSRLEYSLSLAA